MSKSILSPLEQVQQLKKEAFQLFDSLNSANTKQFMKIGWELGEFFLNHPFVSPIIQEIKTEYKEGTCIFVEDTWTVTWGSANNIHIDPIPLSNLLTKIESWNSYYINGDQENKILELEEEQTYLLFDIARLMMKDCASCIPVIMPDIPVVIPIPQPIKRKSVKKQPLEQELESSLIEWLLFNGIEVESQVKTQNSRTDLWIPNHFFLELKRGNITGNDVCQAIDYYNKLKRPIILVGVKLSPQSKKGIDSINNLLGVNAIKFVDWNNVKKFISTAICQGVMSMSNF